MIFRLTLFAILLFGSLTVTAQEKETSKQLTAEQVKFYIEKVEPILLNNCFACHGPGSDIKGDLFMGNRADILQGGDTGPSAIAGNSKESLLIKALNYDGYEMPPKGKLPQDQIDVIAKWIDDGLLIPSDQESARPEAHASPYKLSLIHISEPTSPY